MIVFSVSLNFIKYLGNQPLASSSNVCVFQLNKPHDIEQLQILSCDYKLNCYDIQPSFYNIVINKTATYIYMSAFSLRSTLFTSKIKFVSGLSVKYYNIYTFLLEEQRLQLDLRYYWLSDRILLFSPPSFKNNIDLCFVIDSQADSNQYQYKSTVHGTSATANVNFDTSTNCLLINKIINQKIIQQFIDDKHYDLVDMYIDNLNSQVIQQEVDENTYNLQKFDQYFLFKCVDNRCQFVYDDNLVEDYKSYFNGQQFINKNKLEIGWYCILGVMNDGSQYIGSSIFNYGDPGSWALQFDWVQMVALVSTVLLIWIVWIVFDVCMKKSRNT